MAEALPPRLEGETLEDYHTRLQQLQAIPTEPTPRRTEEHQKPQLLGEKTNGSQHKGLRIIAECSQTGEPVFVLRAKDILSLFPIANYYEMIEKYAPNDHQFQAQIADLMDEFREWQKTHMGQVRFPD